MTQVVAFAIAGALWVWVLVSTLRDRRSSRALRVMTYVGLVLVVPVVGVAYVLAIR